ncbi:MAG: mucoidy inhibitor MuiA family protein [Mediterranea sp.]|nr:mucoidy inhibitor MuiA family protein [Mediterranea sp.]
MAERVTIFINGAQVTRTKQVDIPAGNSSLVFTGLSPYMDAKSVQVSARGRLTITSVNRQLNYADTAGVSLKQRQLQAELDGLAKQQKAQASALEQIKAEEEMLKANCALNGKDSAPTAATVKEIGAYYSSELTALNARRAAIDEKSRALAEKRRKAEGELAQLTNDTRERPLSEVVVGISAKAAGRATFTISYYVSNARWFPSYDVRSSGLAHSIDLVYKANIFQNTREDWKNVALTLSSSNPSIGNVAPQLSTYWLDYGLEPPRYNVGAVGGGVSGVVMDEQREPIIGASVSIPGTTIGTVTDLNGRYSLALPTNAKTIQFSYIGYLTQTYPIQGNMMNVTLKEDQVQLDEVVVVAYSASQNASPRKAEIKAKPKRDEAVEDLASSLEVEQTQTQTGYEFDIKLPYTIASDNKPVVAEIGHYELPASYAYQCTPKIDKDAFLTAYATNWGNLNLLDGEANVYFEETFVGKSIVNVSEQADTLSFSLGRDRRIAVQRVKEKSNTTRQFIGRDQTQTIAWKISVRNGRQEPVNITVYDQLPVSRNGDITVTAEEMGGGTLNAEKGIVSWPLTLRPGEQRDLPLRYRVKYPKGRSLTIE